MIPGSNVLNMALRVLGKQSFQYYAFASRSTNTIGQDVATYASPVTYSASIQPVARNLYEQLGLDLQRNYINLYISRSVLDIKRDVSGDQIVWNGDTYQCLSKTAWSSIDGWDACLLVQIS